MELDVMDFEILDRENYTFKQLKTMYSPAEIEGIKSDYKKHWQKWKELNLTIVRKLPKEFAITKPKIESWTNGWNLRNHFWSAYRSDNRQNENACLAVLLNKKQYQIYLMFQHYKSDDRNGSIGAYNALLQEIADWSRNIDINDYYIWPQVEHELEDHLPLKDYLTDQKIQVEFQTRLAGKTFQIGKILMKDNYSQIENVTSATLMELMPLYQQLVH
ncbi:hypothetical protein EsVE80_19910 [Enterococcus saigonensis]|uniref:Glucose-6-phosphate 1-dehydrogenase n=1 Tax=Enterococcus saigonensis TaxID=1805431 RepID=A0A679I9Y8_9ENTE|nr:HI_0552 family protein [Enterococcus saigonensis]BCA86468.1 hypothetical protein EsVE80_19910 [Enterococcus saigonensis]